MAFSIKDWSWLAGLLEGEGSFGLHRNSIRITMKMTDEDVVRRAAAVTGMGIVYGPYTPPEWNLGKKPYWSWHVTKKTDTLSLMMIVFPMMGERRKQRIETIIGIVQSRYNPFCGTGRHAKLHPGRCLECIDDRNRRRRVGGQTLGLA